MYLLVFFVCFYVKDFIYVDCVGIRICEVRDEFFLGWSV